MRKWYQFELKGQFAGCYYFSDSKVKQVLELNPDASIRQTFRDLWDMRFEMVNENLKLSKIMLDGI